MKLLFTFLIYSSCLLAQKVDYSVSSIQEILLKDANAVIRLEEITVDVSTRKAVNIKTHSAITVLNERGLDVIKRMETRPVKSMSVVTYNAAGKELKKYKGKDFREVSLCDYAEITDNRGVFHDFTPTEYPFTYVYESEVADQNTAVLPSWEPIESPNVAIERKAIYVSYPAELGFKSKEYNFDKVAVEKKVLGNHISYSVKSVPATDYEELSPPFYKHQPYVYFRVNNFHLEGVDGNASTWESFGSWAAGLLKDTDELPEPTIQKIRSLTSGVSTPMDKAKIVYQYVQNKTRYVSIQLGIGGWKPMKAKDVDRLGYGDCKALTNYTRALLNAVGVPSHYAIVYSSLNQDLREDFSSLQGNHIILAIPDNSSYTWLECTSQTDPFGSLSASTENKLALLVMPEGGKLVRTRAYQQAENLQDIKASYSIDGEGMLTGNVTVKTYALRYDNRSGLQYAAPEKKKSYYKELFPLENLEISSMNSAADLQKVEFTETVSLKAKKFASTTAGNLIFPVNAFNRFRSVPKRYRNRTYPLEINSGYTDSDEIVVDIPEGYAVDALPSDLQLKGVFGEYVINFVKLNPKQVLYKRTLKISKGTYPASEYESYRKFAELIARHDNSKLILSRI